MMTSHTACEIHLNRHFYKYTPPRPLEEIDLPAPACACPHADRPRSATRLRPADRQARQASAELKKAEEEILRLLWEVTE